MQTPKIYGEYMLFLSAAKQDKGTDYITRSRRKDFTDEEAWPDYYVKLDLFYPHFAKPYNYYQDVPKKTCHILKEKTASYAHPSPTDICLPSPCRPKGGLRHYDPTKPAVVIDAYEAYNLMADYGLADRPFYHIREDTMCELLASLFVGDMNMHRRYYYEQRYDGKTQKQKTGTV